MPREPHIGGLRLKESVGTAESTAKEIEEKWSTADEVADRLRERGMPDPVVPPVTCPEVTAEMLLNPDPNEYARVYAAQNRWCNYVNRCISNVRAEIMQLTNEMDVIGAKHRSYLRGRNKDLPKTERASVSEMEDIVLQDPRYLELKFRHQKLEQERLQLEAWFDSLERNLRIISRQIENRKLDALSGDREANIPGQTTGRWVSNPGFRR